MSTTPQVNSPDRLSPQLRDQLRAVSLLSGMSDADLEWFADLTPLSVPSDTVLLSRGEPGSALWLLLEGSVAVRDVDPEGNQMTVYLQPRGAALGEVSLLANIPSPWTLQTAEPSVLLRLDEAAFWRLMNDSPVVRQAILRNMALRLQKVQQQTVHQEKMAALGVLAAGLMHELNNPGAAARRAAAQLRDDFGRLQRSSERLHAEPLSPSQRACLAELQQHGLSSPLPVHLSSLAQSDAEQDLADWMETNSIQDAWKLAPALASIGLTADHIVCARHEFPSVVFAESLAWLEALVSTNQRINTIEDSLGRVTELVRSVKTYAYEGSGKLHNIDLNESLQATLVMLGHKLRERAIQVERDLAPSLPRLTCACVGLNQVWTNILDNAIDAVSSGGQIRVKTWLEPSPGPHLCVLIADNGTGIPSEAQTHIFDPFYTTKESGVGTGLGLGIVHKIVEQNHGAIYFTSEPGHTEFRIHLPLPPKDAGSTS